MKLLYKCELCGELCDRIGVHVKYKHNQNIKDYYDQYMKKPGEGKCNGKNCNNDTPFKNCSIGYNKYCCWKCSTTQNGFANPETYQKAIKNGFPLQNKEIYEKTVKTSKERYGSDCYLSSQDYKEKRYKSWIEHYKPLYTTGEILKRSKLEVECKCNICRKYLYYKNIFI